MSTIRMIRIMQCQRRKNMSMYRIKITSYNFPHVYMTSQLICDIEIQSAAKSFGSLPLTVHIFRCFLATDLLEYGFMHSKS